MELMSRDPYYEYRFTGVSANNLMIIIHQGSNSLSQLESNTTNSTFVPSRKLRIRQFRIRQC